jgi:tetratricopeptide (TPR) repeat protein
LKIFSTRPLSTGNGMNRNDFLNMMNESAPVNRQMMGDVYEVIDIFPYFQSAHLLLLKGLQNTADVKFEKQLRNSAIHIADREVLYNFLKNKTQTVETVASVNQEKSLTTESSFDNQQNVIEAAKNSDDLINEIEKESGEKISDEADNSETSTGHSVFLAPETYIEDASSVMLVLEDEFSEAEEKVFFMDPGFSLPQAIDLLELDLDSERSDSSGHYPEEKEISAVAREASGRQLQSELIDKFIFANPRIEPNRDKTAVPIEDISKPFVEEDGGFVTETLAKIYIGQGYYSKAIDIYEKLSLKFPEKSSYFASQIEKVKEYIKK